jgi:hypothetical protein
MAGGVGGGGITLKILGCAGARASSEVVAGGEVLVWWMAPEAVRTGLTGARVAVRDE